MDNQLAQELAWLAGVWDADGCYTAPVNNKRGVAYPEAKVGNTNSALIAKVVEILNGLSISYRIERRPAKRSHKEFFIVRIARIKELNKFLDVIEPFAVGKKAQVSLLRQFVKSRIKRTGLKYHAPKNNEEANFLQQLHILNAPGRRGKRATTTVRHLREDKRQSTPHEKSGG